MAANQGEDGAGADPQNDVKKLVQDFQGLQVADHFNDGKVDTDVVLLVEKYGVYIKRQLKEKIEELATRNSDRMVARCLMCAIFTIEAQLGCNVRQKSRQRQPLNQNGVNAILTFVRNLYAGRDGQSSDSELVAAMGTQLRVLRQSFKAAMEDRNEDKLDVPAQGGIEGAEEA